MEEQSVEKGGRKKYTIERNGRSSRKRQGIVEFCTRQRMNEWCAVQFSIYRFNQHVHIFVSMFPIIFIKRLHSNIKYCIVAFYTITINVSLDDGPVRTATWRSLMFLKYHCIHNDNCVHLLVKTVDKIL